MEGLPHDAKYISDIKNAVIFSGPADSTGEKTPLGWDMLLVDSQHTCHHLRYLHKVDSAYIPYISIWKFKVK